MRDRENLRMKTPEKTMLSDLCGQALIFLRLFLKACGIGCILETPRKKPREKKITVYAISSQVIEDYVTNYLKSSLETLKFEHFSDFRFPCLKKMSKHCAIFYRCFTGNACI